MTFVRKEFCAGGSIKKTLFTSIWIIEQEDTRTRWQRRRRQRRQRQPSFLFSPQTNQQAS